MLQCSLLVRRLRCRVGGLPSLGYGYEYRRNPQGQGGQAGQWPRLAAKGDAQMPRSSTHAP